MSTVVLEIFMWIVVVVELLHELSVCLDEEVSVTAADPEEVRLLAEVCSELLVEVLVHR